MGFHYTRPFGEMEELTLTEKYPEIAIQKGPMARHEGM